MERSEELFTQDLWERVPGRGRHCKGPRVGTCVACPWNSEGDSVSTVE